MKSGELTHVVCALVALLREAMADGRTAVGVSVSVSVFVALPREAIADGRTAVGV
jgi:hypothetical protein